MAGDKATVPLEEDEFGGAAGSTYEMTAANDVLRANIILSQGNEPAMNNFIRKIRFVVKEGGLLHLLCFNDY